MIIERENVSNTQFSSVESISDYAISDIAMSENRILMAAFEQYSSVKYQKESK